MDIGTMLPSQIMVPVLSHSAILVVRDPLVSVAIRV